MKHENFVLLHAFGQHNWQPILVIAEQQAPIGEHQTGSAHGIYILNEEKARIVIGENRFHELQFHDFVLRNKRERVGLVRFYLFHFVVDEHCVYFELQVLKDTSAVKQDIRRAARLIILYNKLALVNPGVKQRCDHRGLAQNVKFAVEQAVNHAEAFEENQGSAELLQLLVYALNKHQKLVGSVVIEAGEKHAFYENAVHIDVRVHVRSLS